MGRKGIKPSPSPFLYSCLNISLKTGKKIQNEIAQLISIVIPSAAVYLPNGTRFLTASAGVITASPWSISTSL